MDVSNASYYITYSMKKVIKVAKWGTPKKYFFKKKPALCKNVVLLASLKNLYIYYFQDFIQFGASPQSSNLPRLHSAPNAGSGWQRNVYQFGHFSGDQMCSAVDAKLAVGIGSGGGHPGWDSGNFLLLCQKVLARSKSWTCFISMKLYKNITQNKKCYIRVQ